METSKERALRTYSIYAKHRDKVGKTDYAVSQAAGITASTLSDWKHGSYTPKYEKLVKITAAIDETIEIFQ